MLSSFDMVGHNKNGKKMKRLLLTTAAASMLMLGGCIIVIEEGEASADLVGVEGAADTRDVSCVPSGNQRCERS